MNHLNDPVVMFVAGVGLSATAFVRMGAIRASSGSAHSYRSGVLFFAAALTWMPLPRPREWRSPVVEEARTLWGF